MEREAKENRFLFDIHTHTSAVSACGQIAPEDVTGLYAAAGYSGIAVTDHFFKEYFDSLGSLTWEKKTDRYLEGYRRAKQNAHGLKVYLGMEFRNTRTSDDFLVLGLTEEFFYAHPETYLLPWEEAFELFHRHGAVVIQAHPCRMRMVQICGNSMKKNFSAIEMLRRLREYPDTPRMGWDEGMERLRASGGGEETATALLRVCTPRCPELLDGVEVYNGNQDWVQDPAEVEALCSAHPRLVRVSASDFHAVKHCARGGIALPFVPADGKELASAIRGGQITELIRALA